MTDAMAEARRLLVVDDDEVFRQRLARALRERGWTVVEAASAREANAALGTSRITHAVVDLRLPDGSGLDVVRAAAATASPPHMVVLTGYGSIATALEAVRRLLAPAPFILKGGGWYVTDYPSESRKQALKSESSASTGAQSSTGDGSSSSSSGDSGGGSSNGAGSTDSAKAKPAAKASSKPSKKAKD